MVKSDQIQEKFVSPEPIVRLVKWFPDSYRNTIAVARTCYSSKGIVLDENVTDKGDKLAESIYRAGHHTTLQHAHYQFTLDRVSRHCIWSFLHSHPFYNSEQVSQRYVEVQPGNTAIPPLRGAALELYQKTVTFQMEQYRALCVKLMPIAKACYTERYPHRSLQEKKYQMDCGKIAQEIARYILPVATFSYLYHTINGVTLLRYYRLCKQFDAPLEQSIVAGKMVEEVLRVEPKYKVILEEPLELDEIPEYRFFETHFDSGANIRRFIEEFDCGLEERSSKLVDYKTANEQILADSVREVLGLPRISLPDTEAIEYALNPEKNTLLAEALNLTTVSKLSRCLLHPSYTFKKKISHTADSQDQRHRMTPASRPILMAYLTEEPDFITPTAIKQDEAIQKEYEETMVRVWDAIQQLKSMGVKDEYANYLLPNAVSVRFTESSDLLNLRHKHAMRLCYNAQEEIWRASLEEAQQIAAVNPTIGRFLLPPCSLRKLSNHSPYCPEGPRFCGKKVWTYKLEEMERII